MARRVVIEINFNNYGIVPDRLKPAWIRNRIAIFRRYTLRCLQRQTNPDFLALLKVAEESEPLLNGPLRKDWEDFPPHVRFGSERTCVEAIRAFTSGYDELFVARLDSDDLYRRTFVQLLMDWKPKPGTVALINQNGYMWDTIENVMAEVYHFSPQFYTYIYKTKDYLDGYRVKLPGKGHGFVIKLPHELLPGRNYVNVVHGANASRKKVPAKGRLSEQQMKAVLSEFM
ncbi:Putative uncharacterized protein [Thermobacillus xylanilyticus]|jgi:hypothetical protein|uniref:Glycosyltransferase family 2 protein n=1 Tax=Thermobacillus xylanilyticus TaxID=76633 RepID=A0ABM8V058_THEXY|nr:glycosyltransferase [Thermobacillus xylanilyticus]REJ16606.1 MAG: hypothetical protein C6W59_07550 [Paenibacillaceae bacterium]CAG5078385.1 Putative uncharacterized protein [Thermobacillus xylanilyticus]